MVIKVYESPYFGHGTKCVHEYRINEGLKSIRFDRYEHKLVIEFDSSNAKMVLAIDDLDGITIGDK